MKKKLKLALLIIYIIGSGYIIYGGVQDTYKIQSNIFEYKNTASYVACGCGCCAGYVGKEVCLYKSKGDNLKDIIDEDEKMASNLNVCENWGCSLGIEYKYCDSDKVSQWKNDFTKRLDIWEFKVVAKLNSNYLYLFSVYTIIFIMFYFVLYRGSKKDN